MSDTLMSGGMSPELLEVVERARREPEGRFHSLAHRIDVSALERAYRRTRKSAAVGVVSRNWIVANLRLLRGSSGSAPRSVPWPR
jgi:hypothetical protein